MRFFQVELLPWLFFFLSWYIFFFFRGRERKKMLKKKNHLSFTSLRRLHLHRKRSEVKQPFTQMAGVSLLKPLKGVDANLISNLETFFTLDYPKVLTHPPKTPPAPHTHTHARTPTALTWPTPAGFSNHVTDWLSCWIHPHRRKGGGKQRRKEGRQVGREGRREEGRKETNGPNTVYFVSLMMLAVLTVIILQLYVGHFLICKQCTRVQPNFWFNGFTFIFMIVHVVDCHSRHQNWMNM